MPKLTAASVEKFTARKTRREISDAACPGLFLVVQTSGSKSFAMRFRNQYGRHVKLTLGKLDVTGVESEDRADDRDAADVAGRTSFGNGRAPATRTGQRCRRPASPPAAGTQGRSGQGIFTGRAGFHRAVSAARDTALGGGGSSVGHSSRRRRSADADPEGPCRPLA